MDPDKRTYTVITRSRKRAKIDTPAAPSTSAVPDDAPPSAPTKPKQQRTRRQGSLSPLLSMPMDILFEIFGHLRPYDLLRLARLTREFRRVLMSRNSIGVWKAARANAPGLPDCPPDMTEPEYANLAFDPRCHNCGAAGVRNADWLLRTRLCAKCSKEIVREQMDFYDTSDDTLPFRDPDGPSTQVYMSIVPHRPSRRPWRVLYLESQLDEVRKAYNALSTDEERKAFVQERRQQLVERRAHAKKCEEWAKTQSQDRSAELQALRDERRRAIIQKLVALGWEEDIRSIHWPDSLDDHRLVKQPHKLTERIWTNIKDDIIEFMQEMRSKRLRRERKALVMKRKQLAMDVLRAYKREMLPETDLMPEPPDFCNFPAIRAIIDRPSEVEVTNGDFEQLRPQFADIIEKWREGLRVQLARVIVSDYGHDVYRAPRSYGVLHSAVSDDEDIESPSIDLPQALEMLSLATTVFTCSACSDIRDPFSDDYYFNYYEDDDITEEEPLVYPRVLAHSCLVRTHSWNWDIVPQDNTNVPDPSTRLECQIRSRRPWKSDCLRYDIGLSELARDVVKAAGKDPETTTAVEMDAMDVRFTCTSKWCRASGFISKTGLLKLKLHTWREAIKHAQLHMGEPSSSGGSWKAVKSSSVHICKKENESGSLNGSRPRFQQMAMLQNPQTTLPLGAVTLPQPSTSTAVAQGSSASDQQGEGFGSAQASTSASTSGMIASTSAPESNDDASTTGANMAVEPPEDSTASQTIKADPEISAEASTSRGTSGVDAPAELVASTSTLDPDTIMADAEADAETGADADADADANADTSNNAPLVGTGVGGALHMQGLQQVLPPPSLASVMLSTFSNLAAAVGPGDGSGDGGNAASLESLVGREMGCHYGSYHDVIWRCARCRDTPQEIDRLNGHGLKRHFRARHDELNPVLNVDYFRDFSVPEYPFVPTVSDHVHKLGSKGKGKMKAKKKREEKDKAPMGMNALAEAAALASPLAGPSGSSASTSSLNSSVQAKMETDA